jgi:hypothetical protein
LIRQLERDDIPEVVSLHERAARSMGQGLPPGLDRHFERIFFDYPWVDPEIRPVAYVDQHGTLAGFLGSSVRRLTWDGRPLRMRISSHLLTDARAPGHAAGALLLRECLDGPQDLTVTDTATGASERLWARLGGHTSQLSSLGWARIFRPARFTRSFLSERRRLRLLAFALGPLAPAFDFVSGRIAAASLRPSPPSAWAEELTPEALAQSYSVAADSFRLRPSYEGEEEFLRWLFDAIRGVWHGQRVVAQLVRGDDRVLGWYVYVLETGRIAQALHIAAKDGAAGEVVDHLFHDAWMRGASGVHGRIEAHLSDVLHRRRCVLYMPRSRVLVHSREAGLLDTIESGRALLTRLDADWWMYGPWWDPVVPEENEGW